MLYNQARLPAPQAAHMDSPGAPNLPRSHLPLQSTQVLYRFEEVGVKLILQSKAGYES